jgi:Flp pilus assembly protein CpaB
VAAAVHGLAPAEPAAERVPVAAHDLAAGQVLRPADLTLAAWPPGARPDGVLAAPAGRVLAGAVRRGEPLTDARVTGPGLLAGQPAGTVAVTVRLSDPAATWLLAPGHRIDLIGGPAGDTTLPSSGIGASADSTNAGDAGADLLAAGVVVLALPAQTGATRTGSGTVDGGAFGTVNGGVAGGGDGSGGDRSGVIVVAADHGTALRLAASAGSRSISAVLTR